MNTNKQLTKTKSAYTNNKADKHQNRKTRKFLFFTRYMSHKVATLYKGKRAEKQFPKSQAAHQISKCKTTDF
jgi:hypothetical protein